jgi:hypothetical protein
MSRFNKWGGGFHAKSFFDRRWNFLFLFWHWGRWDYFLFTWWWYFL